jgi:hypothetical protein
MVKQLLVLMALFVGFNSYVAAEEAPTPEPVVVPLDTDPVVVTDMTPVEIAEAQAVEEVKPPLHREIWTVEQFNEVHGILPNCGALVPDGTYWAPSKEWVADALLPAWIEFKEKMGLKYTERYDCDDFSKMFAAFSDNFYAQHRDNHAESLAVAQYLYTAQGQQIPLPNGLVIEIGGGGHAINVIVLCDGTACFIEPQTGEIVELTEAEMQSCDFVLF